MFQASNIKNNPKILIAGHRGKKDEFPENTMISFQAAIDTGVDMIETDIHMTKDGELVLVHDNTVDRTTDGSGVIKDMTLSELKVLDAGIKKDSRFKGEKIPTLRELLEATKDNKEILFNFEFKDYPKITGKEFSEECTEKILAMIEEYNLVERCVLNSFSADVLEYVEDKYCGKYAIHGYYPLFIMRDSTKNPMDYLSCACLFNKARSDSGKLIDLEGVVPQKTWFDELLAHGIEPWMGAGVKEEKDFAKALEFGAKLFTTDEPGKALRILEKLGVR